MNIMLAAGLFDNPWVVAVFLLVGVLSNWLMQRRKQKQEESAPKDGLSSPAEAPRGKFGLEETLRRLLEQEPSEQPTPPPIIRRAGSGDPSQEEPWQESELLQPEGEWMDETGEGPMVAHETTPRPRASSQPPPVPATLLSAKTIKSAEEAEAAIRYSERISERARHPVVLVDPWRIQRSRTSRWAPFWRNPRNARQAFVTSLVFGPPKGLES